MPVHIDTPQTSDGKAIFIPVLFRGDLHSMYLGFGDDITNGTRFNGQLLGVSVDAVAGSDTEVVWQYMDWVYLAGGMMKYENAVVGDYAEYTVVAPASPATSAPGTGSYDKYDLGGFSMFVPGSNWDLDLEATLNPNVGFTAVVPVPADTVVVGGEEVGTGYFDWDPESNEVTHVPAGTGFYHLFDTELTLSTFARIVMLGDHGYDMRTPSQKPKRVLPHWKHKVRVHNTTNRTLGPNLNVVWNLHYAREDAT